MTAAATTPAYRRHDLSDRAWDTIAPHLSGGSGKVGRPAPDNRRFSNAVFRVLRTGAPWRDLPPDYGHWNTTAHRFGRWQKSGQWAKLLAEVSDDPDLEWLMIDASHIKVHQHGTARARWAAVRPLAAPKGAEYEAAPGGGCPRDAGSDGGHSGDSGGLHSGGVAD